LVNKVIEEGHAEFLTKHHTKTGDPRIVLVNQRKNRILVGEELLLATYHDVTALTEMQDL